MATKRKKVKSDASASRAKESKDLFIGIDLGTNHTAISTSDGKKKSILSIVGTPRDAVASKFLKKERLYGDEALKHRVALNLFKPIESGLLKNQREDLDAARGLLEFVLNSVDVNRDVKKYAIIGVPSQASVLNKKIITEMAGGFFDGVMVASEPFCVAYNLEELEHSLIVDIGAGTTDLCRVHGTIPDPDDQISSNKAGDFIDKELVRLISDEYTNVRVTTEMAKKWKEQSSFVGEPEEEIVVDVPVDSSILKLSITREVKNASESIIPDIMSGISKLISTYDPDFQEDLRNNIWLAGGGSLIKNLDVVLEKELELIDGGSVKIAKDPVFGGAEGALKLAMDMPPEFWQTA
ncbi:MAG: rod shape-determining protein [Candidatus Methanoperedens sp.]|nr:rod shape-determining protein [Candidatus Methanoperedens sp.]